MTNINAYELMAVNAQLRKQLLGVRISPEAIAVIHQLLAEIRDHLHTKQDIARVREMARELQILIAKDSQP